MNDFENIKCLGKGGFGTAYLVRRRRDGKLFALKTIKARGINGMTKQEKNIQAILEFSIQIPNKTR